MISPLVGILIGGVSTILFYELYSKIYDKYLRYKYYIVKEDIDDSYLLIKIDCLRQEYQEKYSIKKDIIDPSLKFKGGDFCKYIRLTNKEFDRYLMALELIK